MNTIYKEVLPSAMGRHRVNLKGENVQILSVAEQHTHVYFEQLLSEDF